jgi:hypothetical protein
VIFVHIPDPASQFLDFLSGSIRNSTQISRWLLKQLLGKKNHNGNVWRLWQQFQGRPASGGGIEYVYTAAGKHHDDLRKATRQQTLQSSLKVSMNTKLPC